MSGLVISPVQQDVYVVLQSFLAMITGLDPDLILQGLPNRTSMPPATPGYITMQAFHTKRLRTNQSADSWLGVADPTTIAIEQGTELRIQLDFYGPSSGDWAAATEALWRSELACVALGGVDGSGVPLVPPICQPLHADEAHLAPFTDSEDQYETRWIIEAILQYNPVVTAPQEYADDAEIFVINVDERYKG